MLDNSVLPREILRHGAYVCVRLADGADRRAVAAAAIPALAEKLGLVNEFDPPGGPPAQSIAFLHRQDATAGTIGDDGVALAVAVVHVAAPTAQPVSDFCAEATRLLGSMARLRIVGGVVRPRTYTGAAMNNFAYAHQVVQQSGRRMPNGFLVPMSTAAGIACLLRRTYKAPTEPAPEGAYDFVTYFECADADVPTFHEVCDALRDVARNPEWKFVREGPMWQGRRVATWAELFAERPR